MHIIQYILNLPSKLPVYTGTGKFKLNGDALASFNTFEFRTLLKFRPDDIGYDVYGVEWRIINVYCIDSGCFYEAFNGTNNVVFNNFNLFNAAEIDLIYQTKIQSEIEEISKKIKQLEKYTPIPEPQPSLTLIKFRPDDIAYDIFGVEWRILSVFEENNKILIKALNDNLIKLFFDYELFNAAEINERYQNRIDSQIDLVLNKLKQLGEYIPIPEPQPNFTTLRFKPDDIAYDIFGIEWRILSTYNNNQNIFIKASNNNTIKHFDDKDLFTASEIEEKYQSVLNVEIEKIINKISQLDSVVNNQSLKNTLLNKSKFKKGDVIFDKKNNKWSVTSVLMLSNKIKYKVSNGKKIKLFDEKDLKKELKK